ncbi:hypothetical protein [Arthrobacter caoxuetaonis]|uniref:Uncharacterized protein n=1 Tax=Arthrobacter caoxuetaonis TaxID=2886935 RepID=A0A9X1SDC2_9MICC|nr:hypothetical protein [Arthrobacter caoxuetaonis]MCC3299485.1 hypothetical protein [Arthrobacter caoxuetaonis]USQ59023.1 hypothetical protein NF551_18125 [Arthrobacter caoxuetaonis]
MTGPSPSYIPFDARLNVDGTVNIFADGNPLPGGQGLSTEAVLRVLSRYARENGTVLMTTVQLNGRITRDLIDGSGSAVPYYVPAEKAIVEDLVEPAAPEDEELLLASLKTRGAGAEPAPEYVPQRLQARRVRPLEAVEEIPDFDVEGDIRKAMASQKTPANMRVIVLVIIGVVVAAAAAAVFYAVSGSLLSVGLPLSEGLPSGVPV